MTYLKVFFICMGIGAGVTLLFDWLEYRDYRRRREALWEQEEEAWLY